MLVRLLKYSSVGLSTFILDLAMLFILTDLFNIYYVLSASLAFLISFSVNYPLSRRYVFTGTLRSVGTGYIIFIFIGSAGLVMVGSLMYALVDLVGLNYIISRVIIAAIVGLWNYFMNLYVNFKVAGK